MGQRSVHLAGTTEFESAPSGDENREISDYHRSAGLWRRIDEVANELGIKTQSIRQRLIPMSYYPEPMRGHIRFRVMGKPRRTELWFPDLAAIQTGQSGRYSNRAEGRSVATTHGPRPK